MHGGMLSRSGKAAHSPPTWHPYQGIPPKDRFFNSHSHKNIATELLGFGSSISLRDVCFLIAFKVGVF